MQLLYQLEIQRDHPEDQIVRFLNEVTFAPERAENHWEEDEYPPEYGRRVNTKDKQFIADIVNYVQTHKEELDELYKGHLKGWKLERLPIVDQSILRLACYEISQRSDIPFVSVKTVLL